MRVTVEFDDAALGQYLACLLPPPPKPAPPPPRRKPEPYEAYLFFCDEVKNWRLLVLNDGGGFEETDSYRKLIDMVSDIARRVPVTLRMENPYGRGQ